MSKIESFFRIVTPKPDTVLQQDSQGIDGSYASFGNYTWYQRLVQGSATRLTRYREYDIMDTDVEVARALDTIAEEMTGVNRKTKLLFDLELQTEEGQQLDGTMVATLRIALRQWSRINDLGIRLHKIARNTVKYGDCFFRRHGDDKKWEWVPPQNILAAVVDAVDVTKIVGYQIRTDTRRPRSAGGAGGPGPWGPGHAVALGQEYNSEYIASSDVIRFTLNDDMSEAAPFGDSILRSVYRSHKQKELLEDAIVIYRIQRAPERRVFYIDVGKMPPHRAKQYLETFKNEIRQRKVPTHQGGKDQIDSVYNPQAMVEDFFFTVRPDGRGSKVDTLPGGQSLGELSDLDYFQTKVYMGLRVPVSWLQASRNAKDVMFNDGKVGLAYIEELRFALFVERLQRHIEHVFDDEFKRYLRHVDVNIDPYSYIIRLPEPSNFGKYRQVELDAQLLNAVGTADGLSFLAKRFILSRIMQLSEDEVITNERLLRQEKGIPYTGTDDDLIKLYGQSGEEVGMGGGLGGGGGIGGPMGAPPGEGGEEMAGLEGGAPGGEAMGMGGAGGSPPVAGATPA